MLSSIVTVLSLLLAVSGAPTPTGAPPTNNGPSAGPEFYILSRSLTKPKAFNNLVINEYHIPPGQSFYIPTLQSSIKKADKTYQNGYLFHLNGTKKDFQQRSTQLVGPLSSPTDQLTLEFSIDAEGGPSKRYAITLSVNFLTAGTKGLYVDKGLLKYNKPGSQGWYGKSFPLRQSNYKFCL